MRGPDEPRVGEDVATWWARGSEGSLVPEILQHRNRGRGGTGPPSGVPLDAFATADDFRTPLEEGIVRSSM